MRPRRCLAPALLLAVAAACGRGALPSLPAALEPSRAVELPSPLWQSQPAATAAAAGASLRGVRAVSARVAWASGSAAPSSARSTVGATWQRLTLPADARTLDFRSVWAFDSLSAVVASAGEAAEARARSSGRPTAGARAHARPSRQPRSGVFYVRARVLGPPPWAQC
jgi:hypothetical protein